MKQQQIDNNILVFPGSKEDSIKYAANDFVLIGKQAIEDHNAFYVALSGGSTPKAIFEVLGSDHKGSLDWSKVYFFWSDERSVPPDHVDSNYKSAIDSGLNNLPIDPSRIHRMVAENNIETNAQSYEEKILSIVPEASFDLIMLGMGDDGHTASLFPNTEGLDERSKLVIANEVPQKDTTRMTMTFNAFHKAKNIAIYVIGDNKASMLEKIFIKKQTYPICSVANASNHAKWIIDKGAAELLSPD